MIRQIISVVKYTIYLNTCVLYSLPWLPGIGREGGLVSCPSCGLIRACLQIAKRAAGKLRLAHSADIHCLYYVTWVLSRIFKQNPIPDLLTLTSRQLCVAVPCSRSNKSFSHPPPRVTLCAQLVVYYTLSASFTL